jgi:hypothetical protein
MNDLYSKRKAYFVQPTLKDDTGNYIACIAVENEPGYYRCDFDLGDDLDDAEEICVRLNARLQITKDDAILIVASSMAGGMR